MEGDILSMHDIFEYKQTGVNEDRVAQGYFMSTGIRPQVLGKLEACGAALSVEMFERKILGV